MIGKATNGRLSDLWSRAGANKSLGKLKPRNLASPRHWTDPDRRLEWDELRRLRLLPRYQPGDTPLLGGVRFVDSASFVAQYEQIFRREIYRFNAGEAPRILDCGANLGLATIYWKRHYPAASVTAFEPDPTVADVLEWNLSHLGIHGVEIVRCAVAAEAGPVRFWAQGADGGRITSDAEDGPLVEVPAVSLAPWLVRPVDLLKLDIEGTETAVIEAISDRLGLVSAAFVEYHGFPDQPQQIARLLALLTGAGFRMKIESEGSVVKSPFIESALTYGMDEQLNIWALRP